MSKASLTERVAAAMHCSKAEATRQIDAVLGCIADEIATGEDLRLPALGLFKTRLKPARMYNDVRNGGRIEKPAHRVVQFTPAARLVERVN